MQKSCNLIESASYEILEQLHVLQVIRLFPAGVRGWLHKVSKLAMVKHNTACIALHSPPTLRSLFLQLLLFDILQIGPKMQTFILANVNYSCHQTVEFVNPLDLPYLCTNCKY